MDGLTQQKLVAFNVLSPAAIVDNASYTTNCVDTQGFTSVAYYVHIGATDIAMVALKVQESDTLTNATTLGGTPVDISGANFATAPATLPSATADNTILRVIVKVRGNRLRYQKLVATAGDGTVGTFLACIAVCTPKEVPNTVAGLGLGQQLVTVQ